MLGVSSEVHSNCLLALTPTLHSIITIVKNSSSSTVDLSIIKQDNPVKKIVRIMILGSSFFMAAIPAAMADNPVAGNTPRPAVEMAPARRMGGPVLQIVNPTPIAPPETLSVGEMALATADGVVLKDGHPSLSMMYLTPNLNDSRQRFTRQTGNLIRNVSTGKCLNAYQPAPGIVVNVYPCNANDADQRFEFIPASNNANYIRRQGTNLCLEISMNNLTRLMTCNTSPNQQFVSNATLDPKLTPRAIKVNNFVQLWEGKTSTSPYNLIYNYATEGYFSFFLNSGLRSYTLSNLGKISPGNFAIMNVMEGQVGGFTKSGNPIPGSIMAFPKSRFGHMALVINSQRNGNSLNVTILESNTDGLPAAQSKVTKRNITIDLSNPVSASAKVVNGESYGNGVYWVNPIN
jgi:Ricin-type beta-trefoil lectin domain